MIAIGLLKTIIGYSKCNIITGTRNAGGSQAITGMGFRPKLLMALARDTTAANINYSVGFCNSNLTQRAQCVRYDGTQQLLQSMIMYISRDAVPNTLYGVVTSFDVDGVTIAWTIAGAVDLEYVLLGIA